MNPHLNELLDSLDRQVVECRELCEPLSDDQLKWKPDPRSWCILECFDQFQDRSGPDAAQGLRGTPSDAELLVL